MNYYGWQGCIKTLSMKMVTSRLILGQAQRSFIILTTDASQDTRPIHHRMPVILTTLKHQLSWISNEKFSSDLAGILSPLIGLSM